MLGNQNKLSSLEKIFDIKVSFKGPKAKQTVIQP